VKLRLGPLDQRQRRHLSWQSPIVGTQAQQEKDIRAPRKLPIIGKVKQAEPCQHMSLMGWYGCGTEFSEVPIGYANLNSISRDH